ncbi:MAG: hypothetical protein JXL84_00230 [Deltaproteobacteria bacterium]|nr:hypothetical protein [Deltaproteobacteria bacterium]
MRRARPTQIVLEYDDGTRSAVSFETLPLPLQIEIMRQPFAGRPSPDPQKERYLLLEWDDGWKEVIEVDAGCTELNRYYVISRPEDVGRLSLHKEAGYPELIEVMRKPKNLRRITLLDTFDLTPTDSIREGKKVDHLYALSKVEKTLPEWVQMTKEALREENLEVRKLLSGTPSETNGIYERLRRRMNLHAGQRQQDVYDFLACLVRLAVQGEAEHDL